MPWAAIEPTFTSYTLADRQRTPNAGLPCMPACASWCVPGRNSLATSMPSDTSPPRLSRTSSVNSVAPRCVRVLTAAATSVCARALKADRRMTPTCTGRTIPATTCTVALLCACLYNLPAHTDLQ